MRRSGKASSSRARWLAAAWAAAVSSLSCGSSGGRQGGAGGSAGFDAASDAVGDLTSRGDAVSGDGQVDVAGPTGCSPGQQLSSPPSAAACSGDVCVCDIYPYQSADGGTLAAPPDTHDSRTALHPLDRLRLVRLPGDRGALGNRQRLRAGPRDAVQRPDRGEAALLRDIAPLRGVSRAVARLPIQQQRPLGLERAPHHRLPQRRLSLTLARAQDRPRADPSFASVERHRSDQSKIDRRWLR